MTMVQRNNFVQEHHESERQAKEAGTAKVGRPGTVPSRDQFRLEADESEAIHVHTHGRRGWVTHGMVHLDGSGWDLTDKQLERFIRRFPITAQHGSVEHRMPTQR